MTPNAWKYVRVLGGALGKRHIATTKCLRGELTLVDVDNKTGVATLTMNRSPINALNVELLGAIRNSLDLVERNNSRGLILTSSLRSVFSAGLDITEIYKPDKDRLHALYSTLQDICLHLSTSFTPVVALINGHAPAGGCVLGLSCEYRVMVLNYTIGLNETVLGLVAPKWIMESYLEVLPRRCAELALTRGKLFLTEEALKIGLIDEVANDKTEGVQACHNFIDHFKGVNPTARALTKRQIRVNSLIDDKQADLAWFVAHILQPEVQESLGAYLDSLKMEVKE